MSAIDGTHQPTATYVEQENHGMQERPANYRVQHGGSLYQGLSPLHLPVFGTPTKNGKFTEVIVEGQVVYSEDHPGRQPQA